MGIVNLNLGGGLTKVEDYLNVDILKGSDIVHDLNVFPYPFKDNSVGRIICSHTLEHLKEPELFFKEVQRILRRGGRITITVPHYKHEWAFSNFGHRGFYEPDAIDNVTIEDGHIVEKPFLLIKKKVVYRNKLFWKPKEIIWEIEKQ